jgi:hypothetical protein
MRTEPENHMENGAPAISGGPASMDPEELWLDQDIQPHRLVRLDPLDITAEMVEQAEHPELGDFTLRTLPVRAFSLRLEVLLRHVMKEELRSKRNAAPPANGGPDHPGQEPLGWSARGRRSELCGSESKSQEVLFRSRPARGIRNACMPE